MEENIGPGGAVALLGAGDQCGCLWRCLHPPCSRAAQPTSFKEEERRPSKPVQIKSSWFLEPYT